MTNWIKQSHWCFIMMAVLLSGCGSSPPVRDEGGYSGGTDTIQDIKDSGPGSPMDVSHIPDAVPKVELRTIAGNKTPYTVLGQTYHVLSDSKGFRQEGIGSWYGSKFHGRRTSNGEIYDMYGMTAAHKTLPIPSYVRVTNQLNGRSVIVRVNDRGPFHDGRVIDLSYTAATKLGYAQTGTAPVRVEAVEPAKASISASSKAVTGAGSPNASLPKVPTPDSVEGYQLPPNTFLQAGAFSSASSADSIRVRVERLTQYPVRVVQQLEKDALYRVRIGPIADNWELMQLRELLLKNKLPLPHVVYD